MINFIMKTENIIIIISSIILGIIDWIYFYSNGSLMWGQVFYWDLPHPILVIPLYGLFIFGTILKANKTPANNSQIRNGVKKKTATGLSTIKYSDKKIDVKNAVSKRKIIKIFLNLNFYKKNNMNGNKT